MKHEIDNQDEALEVIAAGVHGIELPAYDGICRVLYEFYRADGRCEYSMLVTNLPADDFGVAHLFAFYNERQTSEAFFCQSRQVFHIHTLRSRQFNAIAAFLHFVFLTHNLLVWVKQARFAQTDLAAVTCANWWTKSPAFALRSLEMVNGICLSLIPVSGHSAC